MSWSESLIGAGPKVSPQTPQGQAMLNDFMARYGIGGSIDATRAGGQLADLQTQVMNSKPMNLKFGGGSIPFFDPALKGKVKAANSLFARSIDPANAGALELEKYRMGGQTPTDPGLLGRLAPGLGLLAAAGMGGGSKNGATGTSWLKTIKDWFGGDSNAAAAATGIDPANFDSSAIFDTGSAMVTPIQEAAANSGWVKDILAGL